MGREWTQQQKNAINATDGSVLVSAAAGSGKTAVLVERVIGLVTREENPIDVDRLLIVTFTRAAAAEMRQRISAALSALLEKDPYNPQYLKQKQLLYNANISTIDSFCGEIVREYFHTLDVSRDFRLADKGELDILCSEALDSTFEKFYKKDDAKFINLVNAFSGKNGDINLRHTVLKVCEFLSTQPFAEKWLDNMLENYSEKPIADTIWGKIIIDCSGSAVSHAINLTENSLKLLNEEADEKLNNAFVFRIEEELAEIVNLQKVLFGGSWNEILSCLNNISFGRLTPPRGYADNPIKLAVAANRNEVKAVVKTINSYFIHDEDESREEIRELHSIVEALFDVVREYLSALDNLKKRRNVLSFSDVELLAVKLLAVPDGEGYAKTPQAYEISQRFDAVMVDEFQDINDVQDLIFKCVSSNESNLFAVGDVKQSIYGFRQAKPEIFINRKNSYSRFDEKNPSYPATIILDKNFRSRKEVCDTVNFIFKNLMTEESAQMDYTDDEKLNAGASYPENPDCGFELTLIENNAFEDCGRTELEAHYIANKIHNMIGSGFLVKDGEAMRRATYGDFAVILRSANLGAKTYVSVLNACGIPAYSENKENSFEVQEIQLILNFLRIIDNPTLDIPLLSVMCSPIYGFTPDELSLIRANDRYSNLYSAVNLFAENNKKASDFLSELKSLRAYAYTSNVDDLIGKIYEITSIAAITSAVKGGTNPTKNLSLLREYARSFESNGYKTLSEFISYIDRLIENGTEFPSASELDGDNLNRVRVLSIHASKGLEFPICFLADTAHGFNTTDLKEDILIDSHSGLGIKKKEGICRYNTLPRLAVGIEMSGNMKAEEMRVLYVALTRAKEKLIAVSSQADVLKYLSGLYSKIVFDKIIEPYTVAKCDSISDWICLCALIHPSMNDLRKRIEPSSQMISFDEDTSNWKINIIDKKEMIFDDNGDRAVKQNDDDFDCVSETSNKKDCVNMLEKSLNFKYRNSEIMNLPQKVSASEIAHEQNSSYFDKVLSKPAFLNTEISSSVERGTAHHKFLQHCDFASAKENLDAEIARLAGIGALSKTQAECIDTVKISEFLSSELVTRITKSPVVMREERFTAKIEPSLIFDEYKDKNVSADIIIQGAVDIAFVEDNELVIVDYKTDRVRDIEKLRDLYSKQLSLYKVAMEQSTDLKVKECVICSIHLNKYLTI